jgi:hypothetical protein
MPPARTTFPFKRSRWQSGMVYAIPLSDGSFCFAQAAAAAMANVIDIAILARRVHELPSHVPDLSRQEVVALGATWRQHLNRGQWHAIGISASIVPIEEFPNQRLLKAGAVGIQHMDAGLWEKLLDAWYGLRPWNVMYEEDYFDKKLAPGVCRPASAIVLSSDDRERFRAQSLASNASPQ